MRKAVILHKGENRSEGEVINIIECTEQGVMGLTLPEEQSLWDCTQYAVSLGDLFKDGVFYHQSEPVKRIPTLEEKLAQVDGKATAEIDDLKSRQEASESAILGLMQMQLNQPM